VTLFGDNEGVIPPFLTGAIVLRDAVPPDGFDDVLVEPFMPNSPIVTFDVSILLRLARLDMLDRDVAFLRPFQELATDVFQPIINPNAFWSSPPLDARIRQAGVLERGDAASWL